MCFDIENELNKLNKYGSKLGLDRIRELLNRLGNPQKQLRIVHIGGTNGKGSVVCYLESIAIASKIKCGAYTSPALSKFNENTRINDRWIEKTQAQKIYNKIIIECEKMVADGFEHPTRFEVETVIAFCHFAIEKCEIVFLEVGLGGELDATNIIENPILTLFTSISIDHIAEFGDSLQSVTKAECGIIKESVPVIISPNQEEEVLEVIKQITTQKNSPLTIANLYEKPLKNKAIYAPINAGLAQATAEILGFNNKAIKKGINKANWLGRFSIITLCTGSKFRRFLRAFWFGIESNFPIKPIFILDGAHNETAIEALTKTLKKEYDNKKITAIVSINSDKNADKMLEMLSKTAHKIICLGDENNKRLLSVETLETTAKTHFSIVEKAITPLDAVIKAKQASSKKDIIVATGSLSHLSNVSNAYVLHVLWNGYKWGKFIADFDILTDNWKYKRVKKILLDVVFNVLIKNIENVEENRKFCKHGLEHLITVAKLALKENEKLTEKIDPEVVIISALLHDIGRFWQYSKEYKKTPHAKIGKIKTEERLQLLSFIDSETKQICSAIETHNDDSVSNDTGLNGIIYRADKASRDCNNCKAKYKCKNYL
ncbi:MAG: HD domain-containing protein [Firmicutes bacterium]|nr:HD domain-containing protein [Bacillota bacterium]